MSARQFEEYLQHKISPEMFIKSLSLAVSFENRSDYILRCKLQRQSGDILSQSFKGKNKNAFLKINSTKQATFSWSINQVNIQ